MEALCSAIGESSDSEMIRESRARSMTRMKVLAKETQH